MADSTASQLTPDAAYEQLMDRVYSQTLMAKLAANGIVPETEAEYRDLLVMASSLRSLTPEKQASSRFSTATQALTNFASTSPVFAATQAQGVKTAAAHFASDPTIYDAVLTMLAAEQNTLAGNK